MGASLEGSGESSREGSEEPDPSLSLTPLDTESRSKKVRGLGKIL